MTYYGAKNLATSFRTVRKNTLTIANEIPEDKYSFRAADGTMSVGELLAHMADQPDVADRGAWPDACRRSISRSSAQRMQMGKQAEAALRTKAEITRALTENGEQFAAFVDGLDDAHAFRRW